MKTREGKNQRSILLVLILSLAMAWFWSGIAVSQSIDTLWYEDWEGNWSNDWHVDYSTWEVGTPSIVGPDSAHHGINCAATILDGNYVDGQDTRLIRHSAFVVPPATMNPRLRFWHWYWISGYDWGKVQVRVVGDTIGWQTLPNGDYRQHTGGYHSAYKWTRPSLDLSEYAGQEVEIAFWFKSVPGYVNAGWYIDEVLVETGEQIFNNPEDWESGIDDWYVDQGTWEVGVPISGPGEAYEGTNCAATILDGNYYDGISSRLISPLYYIPDANHNPRLRFWHWYWIAGYDWGKVQVRVVGDTLGWQTLDTYEGASDTWVQPYHQLSNFAGQIVQFCFWFKSVSDYVSSGWYIDSLSVQADNLGIITGIVQFEGAPVENVYVRAVENSYNALTDTSGQFILSLVDPGIFDISFSHPEYEDTTLYGVVVNSNETTYLDIIELPPRTGINDDPIGTPTKFTLNQNFPNPFNAQTVFEYALPEASHVTIEIYDLLGRHIETLVDEYKQAGYHQATWDAKDQASGMYFYKIQAGEFIETKKMTLLK